MNIPESATINTFSKIEKEPTTKVVAAQPQSTQIHKQENDSFIKKHKKELTIAGASVGLVGTLAALCLLAKNGKLGRSTKDFMDKILKPKASQKTSSESKKIFDKFTFKNGINSTKNYYDDWTKTEWFQSSKSGSGLNKKIGEVQSTWNNGNEKVVRSHWYNRPNADSVVTTLYNENSEPIKITVDRDGVRKITELGKSAQGKIIKLGQTISEITRRSRFDEL